MNILENQKLISVILFAVSLLIFTQGLSIHSVEYRDDEIFYFKSTQEMLEDGNYFSPTYFGENRFQKPILFYWFILIFYKIFGVHWFAARFVSALFAALSICMIYHLARLFFSSKTALLSALILASGPLFLRHAKNVVPDMALSFFILASIYYALVTIYHPSRRGPNILFFIMSALGFMVKGIAAVAVPLGVVLLFLVFIKRTHFIKQMPWIKGLLIWLLICAPWFIYMNYLHGSTYMEYMLVEETKNRILGYEQQNYLLVQAKRFVTQLGFYLRTILSYYLPWSLVLFFLLPVLAKNAKKESEAREGMMLCGVWVLWVIFIFSNMYFNISHYMLVLGAPLSIIVAHGLVRLEEEHQPRLSLGLNIFLAFAMAVGLFAFAFLLVFLAEAGRWWLLPFLVLFISIPFYMVKKNSALCSSLILGAFIIVVFSQSMLMVKAGVSSHGTLQKFAAIIQAQALPETLVGIGSHDIHEKEFQVYFDREIVKAGHSHKGANRQKLQQLFDHHEEVYCLLTQNDYNEYQDLIEQFRLKVVATEFMTRKRMKLDKGFLVALVTFDQGRVRSYLMEPIILLKKDKHA